MIRVLKKRRTLGDIGAVSLADIIFNLFLFFFITFSLVFKAGAKNTPEIPVNLPEAAAAAPLSPETDLVVYVTRDGTFHMDGKPVSLAEIKLTLEETKKTKPAIGLIVRADRDVRHGAVVDLMDAARGLGIERLGIAVQTAP